MRYVLAASLLAAAVPAHATGGLLCRPLDGDGPSIGLVIGHGTVGGIAGANLIEGERVRSTMGADAPLMLAQAWIDDELLLADLSGPDALEHVARLRARFEPARRGSAASGTLAMGGETFRVRCEER